MWLSCQAQYCHCCDSEARASFNNFRQVSKEYTGRDNMNTATMAPKAVTSSTRCATFVFFLMPVAELSIWSQNVLAHYGWIGLIGWLAAVRDTLGDRYDHFFETRLEFLFPSFLRFGTIWMSQQLRGNWACPPCWMSSCMVSRCFLTGAASSVVEKRLATTGTTPRRPLRPRQ